MLSAAPIALLFKYCPFNSQMGIQFWFLIGAFEGLIQGKRDRLLQLTRATAISWRGMS